MKQIHWIISIIIILLNCFVFFKLSYQAIVTSGGAMGFGLILLPFTLPINFLTITAMLSFTKKVLRP